MTGEVTDITTSSAAVRAQAEQSCVQCMLLQSMGLALFVMGMTFLY